MSILGALKVQKANQQSIADLAALPQNQIIRLAQMGQIPADVVPVVISEKARMAQEAANLRAAQQAAGGEMPTVIEQAMRANAQEEMPRAESGVAGIPLGKMFREENFNSGGIVAFQGGGVPYVEMGRTATAEGDEGVAEAQAAEAARRAAAEETPPPKPTAAPKGLEDIIASVKRAYGGAETSGITPERQAYLNMLKTGSMSPQDIERQEGMRLLQAGLGILGGQSPYALKNIADGSKEALMGYAEDIKGQRAQKVAEAKAAADVADLRRAEQRQEIGSAIDMYGKQLDREQRARLAAERTSVADRYARNYAAKMQKAGDKRSIEDLLDEGYTEYLEAASRAQQRIETTAATALAGQGVQLAGQRVTAQGQAIDARATAETNWTKMSRDNPIAKEYRRLARQDKENAEKGNPTNLAETYKNNEINAAANRILTGQTTAPTQPGPAAGAAGPTKPNISSVPNAPSGSSVGNFVPGKGWEIKDKDGKLLGHAK
jgi:hypothetical protein